MINLINDKNVYDTDLHITREKEHINNLSWKNCPRWDPRDPKQSQLHIREYIDSLHGSNRAPCPYMISKDIIPLKHQ